jgi:hypothetical protein
MIKKVMLVAVVVAIVIAAVPRTVLAQDDDAIKMWPQVMRGDLFTVTMFEPQIDSWKNNTFDARAAVSVAKGEDAPVYGAVWLRGRFDVDRDTRMVSFFDVEVPTVAFPETSEGDRERLASFLEERIPTWDLEIELDRLVPLLEDAEIVQRSEADLKHAPPEIIVKYEPAVLILIDGEPKLEGIEGSSLERVVNTPYVILKHKSSYYLASDTRWFESPSVKGPWKLAGDLPKDVQRVDEELRKQQQEQGASKAEASDKRIPEIVVSTVPAELIFIDGQPKLEPFSASEVMMVSNTDSDVLFEIASQNYYALLSGRWYRTKDLDHGPWTWVANDELSVEFSEIPAESDVGYLRASVAGTDEAQEALLEQAVPQTATVKMNAGASFTVEYDGTPQFQPVDGTRMTYAVNTSAAVIKSGGRYYCCDQGIWYESTSATGPWMVCKDVPDEIYTIPPSNPHYNVTYVKVYESTPEVVYVGYTPGYTSSYISHGCVVYGTGWYYRPYWGPRYYYPHHSTWGFHVRWNPWYGWGFGLSWSTGPFNFSVGFGGWGWGGHWHGGWWGPGWYRPYPWYGYGAGYRAGYRHGYLHGSAAASRPRPTPYGRTRPNNNIYARPANSDRVAATRDRVTPDRRPAVARDRDNNIYTDRSGNVYRRNDDGSWDRRGQGGWSKVDVPGRETLPGPSTRPSTRPSVDTRPSTRPSVDTRPSTRPSTGSRPSTGPSTGSRPTTGQRPVTRPATTPGSLNRAYGGRQRGDVRAQQLRRSGGAARRPAPTRRR